jgi:hypothetical protein
MKLCAGENIRETWLMVVLEEKNSSYQGRALIVASLFLKKKKNSRWPSQWSAAVVLTLELQCAVPSFQLQSYAFAVAVCQTEAHVFSLFFSIVFFTLNNVISPLRFFLQSFKM